MFEHIQTRNHISVIYVKNHFLVQKILKSIQDHTAEKNLMYVRCQVATKRIQIQVTDSNTQEHIKWKNRIVAKYQAARKDTQTHLVCANMSRPTNTTSQSRRKRIAPPSNQKNNNRRTKIPIRPATNATTAAQKAKSASSKTASKKT